MTTYVTVNEKLIYAFGGIADYDDKIDIKNPQDATAPVTKGSLDVVEVFRFSESK